MPIQQTGWSGEVAVPCSHCNSDDEGPESGICHRNSFDDNNACHVCLKASGTDSALAALIVGMSGQGNRIPRSYCDGKGYRKL